VANSICLLLFAIITYNQEAKGVSPPFDESNKNPANMPDAKG